MFCKYCGNQIDNGSSFCKFCGARLDEVSPQAQQAQNGYTPPEQIRPQARSGYPSPEPIRRPEHWQQDRYQQGYRMEEYQTQDRYQQQEPQPPEYRQQAAPGRGRSAKPKKKKGRGIKILLFLVLLVIVSCAGLYFIGKEDGPAVKFVEPAWVNKDNIQDVDPGPLYEYLDDEQKELYKAVKSAMEGNDYGWFSYHDVEGDNRINEMAVAFLSDYPLVSDLTLYATSDSRTKDGKPEMRIEELRKFEPDYNEILPIVKKVAGSLTGTTSEKVQQISEYLCENTVYDEESELAYTCYGALVEGRAVCQGYSAAFNAICQEAGIRSYAVSGTTYLSSGRTGDHVWNIVKLEDGNWYELDLTSTDAYDSKSYYCIPSSQMAKYHKRGGLMGKLTWIVPVTQE